MAGKIAPSMMCAGLDVSTYIALFERTGIEYLHVDVMDGEFVPNIMLGTDYIKMLRKKSKIPLDIHLMITKPEDKIHWFDPQPGEYISVHAESTYHLQRTLQRINASGAKAMVALNPATPLSVLDYVLDDIAAVLLMTVNPGYAGQGLIPQTIGKIADLKAYLAQRGRSDIEIEIDGNVSFENAVKMKDAGADIFVAGSSSVFHKDLTTEQGIVRLREAIR